MLKLLLAILVGMSCTIATAADTVIAPLQAIEQFGAITIGDGSSFFKFSNDGTFESGPLDQSGRTMKGYWTKGTNGRLVVTARLGWINGLSSRDQYRRIIFYIAHVSKAAERPNTPMWRRTPEFDSYFFIDEMTAVPKPEKAIPE